MRKCFVILTDMRGGLLIARQKNRIPRRPSAPVVVVLVGLLVAFGLVHFEQSIFFHLIIRLLRHIFNNSAVLVRLQRCARGVDDELALGGLGDVVDISLQ